MKKLVWAVINLLLCYAFPYWVGFVVILSAMVWIMLVLLHLADKYDITMQEVAQATDGAWARLSSLVITIPGYLYLSTIATGTILGLAMSKVFIGLAVSSIFLLILTYIAKYELESGGAVEEV